MDSMPKRFWEAREEKPLMLWQILNSRRINLEIRRDQKMKKEREVIIDFSRPPSVYLKCPECCYEKKFSRDELEKIRKDTTRRYEFLCYKCRIEFPFPILEFEGDKAKRLRVGDELCGYCKSNKKYEIIDLETGRTIEFVCANCGRNLK